MAKAAAVLLLTASGFGAAVAQNYDGSGLVKFGVFGQGTWLEVDQTLPVAASSSPSGFAGGVSAGYDLRIRDYFLLGLEIDGSFGDVRARAADTDYGFDYLLTARGRLGTYLRPGWLLYGTAGIGFLGTEAQLPGNTQQGTKAAETLTGFVGGVGTEIDVYNHFILFGEYLYGNFGDRSFTLVDPRLGPINPNTGNPTGLEVRHNASIDAHMLRLGIKFKVGHDYAHDYDHPDHYKRINDSLK